MVHLKKFLRLVVLAAVLTSLVALNVSPGYAQGTTDNTINFSLLTSGDITLRGPLDDQALTFSLPADWEMTAGTELHLNLTAFVADLSSQAAPTADVRRIPGGFMEVSLNNTFIGSTTIDKEGDRAVTLPITNALWAALSSDGRQSLAFRLKTSENCEASLTTVLIHPSSFLVLPHRNVTPVTDLTRLPYPIFQRSFLPDSAVLVTPDQPSASELQAALTVSAAFGRMTSGQMQITLTTSSKVTVETLKSTHAILVGKPAGLPQLSQATWPAPVSGQGFAGSDIGADDGVLQYVTSPWNGSKVLLLVSGQSDAAVVKASQAVGSGVIRTSRQPNLAIVAETQPKSEIKSQVTDHTLADLGYGTETRWGPGLRFIVYRFEIPPSQMVNGDAYLDLVFSHGAMFDFEQAGLSVALNDELVGSMRFSDRTTRVSTWRLNLPRLSFRAGSNVLMVRANLKPASPCVSERDVELWFSSRAESSLHLPLGPVQGLVRKYDLSAYPAPFVPTFDRTAFVLANNDPASWGTASRVAFDLGQRTEGTLINPVAVFADSVPESLRQQRDLVLVGRPSTLPIINELGAALPAPFDPGSDIANEPNAELKFRISKDLPVGYLQILPAPWNADRTVMVVLGNSEQGLNWASTALATGALRSQLAGNLAVVNGNQVLASQVRLQAKPNATPAAPSAQAAPSTPASSGFGGNVALIVGVFIVLLILVAVAAFALGRKQRT